MTDFGFWTSSTTELLDTIARNYPIGWTRMTEPIHDTVEDVDIVEDPDETPAPKNDPVPEGDAA